MFGLKEKETAVINAAAHLAPEVPAAKVPSFIPAKRSTDASLDEYASVALAVGVSVPHLIVEDFLTALEKLNYPIYNRAEVVKYMDEKAKKDGKGWGWEWRPVRDKDHIPNAYFGQPARQSNPLLGGSAQSASDYYSGPASAPAGMDSISQSLWAIQNQPRTPQRYDKVIPLHALQRIAGIEREYKKPAYFLVSDYATEPHIKPDPFLMVVIPGVPSDLGRFIIDFWDEPGFGIDKMLK